MHLCRMNAICLHFENARLKVSYYIKSEETKWKTRDDKKIHTIEKQLKTMLHRGMKFAAREIGYNKKALEEIDVTTGVVTPGS